MTPPKPAGGKRWLYGSLGLAGTVALLVWALRDVSLPQLAQAIGQAQLGWLLLGWLTYGLSYWVRAHRWGLLLSATVLPGRFRSRLVATFIGFGASSLLPAYVGEVLRAGILQRQDRVPIEAAVGSIFAERVLDLGGVLLLLLLPLWGGFLPDRPLLQTLPLLQVGGVILLIWAGCVLGASFPKAIAQIISQLGRSLGKPQLGDRLAVWLSGFLGGLQALRQPVRSGIAFAETLLIWLLNGLTYWFGLIAFGLLEPGFWGALWVQSTTALAIALPATPGYVGSFEAGIRFGLSLYDLPINTVIAYAIALRFVMFITTPIVAIILALRLGLSRSDLSKI